MTEMTEPGWYCEHCEKPAAGISDEADAAERQTCHTCHKRVVVWLTPAELADRLASMNATAPTLAIKEQLAATSPKPIKRADARAMFQQMRQLVDQATDQTDQTHES